MKKIDILKEEKGSSLIWVVIVMAIIIGLGGNILLMSVGNLKMAKRVNESTKEYYDIEKEAEIVLKQIDKNLEEAEVATMQYMLFELYTRPSLSGISLKYKQISDNSDDLKLKTNDVNSGVQSFFYKRWKEKIYNPSLINITEADGSTRKVLDEKKYNKLLDSYLDDSFGKMYAYLAQNKLKKYLKDHSEGILDIRTSEIYYKVAGTTYYLSEDRRYHTKESLYRNDEKNKKYFKNFTIGMNSRVDFSRLSSGSNWDKTLLDENIKIVGNLNSIDANHKLDMEAYITTPVYQARQQEKTLATKGNPIWTQAISANGDIKLLNRKKNIYGDIFGKNIYFHNSPTNIYGNIYSSGNISLKGLNTIYISNYRNNTKKEYKLKIYDNNKAFFKYIESNPDYSNMSGYTYLLAKDYEGGNVYCNKILLDAADINNNITVGNYIWTKEDIDQNVIDIGINKDSVYNLFKNTNYRLASNCREGFKKAFNSKTEYFGTENKNFNNLIDIDMARTFGKSKTGIEFLNAGQTLNISGNKKGIVVSNGDLNITGNGNFEGTIIADGNITIDGDINFYYSEDVIGNILQGKDVFGNNKNADKKDNIRKVFRRGEMGENLFSEQKRDIDSQTRHRVTHDRYKITKWREGR